MPNVGYYVEFEFLSRKFNDTRIATREKRKPTTRRKHLKAKAPAIAMKNLNYLPILLPNIIIILLALLLILATNLQCKSSPSPLPSSLKYLAQQQPDSSSLNGHQARQAHFAELEAGENVQTVAVGRPVKFKCVVNDIGDHKVSIVPNIASSFTEELPSKSLKIMFMNTKLIPLSSQRKQPN